MTEDAKRRTQIERAERAVIRAAIAWHRESSGQEEVYRLSAKVVRLLDAYAKHEAKP